MLAAVLCKDEGIESRDFAYYIPPTWIRNQVRWGMRRIRIHECMIIFCWKSRKWNVYFVSLDFNMQIFFLFSFQHFQCVQLEWKILNSRHSGFPNEQLSCRLYVIYVCFWYHLLAAVGSSAEAEAETSRGIPIHPFELQEKRYLSMRYSSSIQIQWADILFEFLWRRADQYFIESNRKDSQNV